MKKPVVFFQTNIPKSWFKNKNIRILTMQHISGISRQQIQFSSPEDEIALDNSVRFIEAFVETISIQKLGFTVQIPTTRICNNFLVLIAVLQTYPQKKAIKAIKNKKPLNLSGFLF